MIDFRDEVFPVNTEAKLAELSPAAAYLRDNGFTALCEPTTLLARESFEGCGQHAADLLSGDLLAGQNV